MSFPIGTQFPGSYSRSSQRSNSLSTFIIREKRLHFSYCIRGQLLKLDELPHDILNLLLAVLPDIETLLNLSTTCCAFRNICNQTLPSVIIRLASSSNFKSLRPAPYFLCAITARDLSNWAVKSNGNRAALLQALKNGIDSLSTLNNKVSYLSINDLRSAVAYRRRYMNPFIHSRQIGPIFPTPRNLYEHWASLLSVSIYGDLFHHSFEKLYNPSPTIRSLPLEFRFAFQQVLPSFVDVTSGISSKRILARYVDWFPETRDERRLFKLRTRDALAIRATVYMGWQSFIYHDQVMENGDLGQEWEKTIRDKMNRAVITYEDEHNFFTGDDSAMWPGLLDDFYLNQRRGRI